MIKKWRCNTKCYVSVGGVLKLRHPGDLAEGEVTKSAEKFFDPITPLASKPIAPDPEVEARRVEIKKELDTLVPKVKYHPSTGLDKLEALLTAERKKREQPPANT